MGSALDFPLAAVLLVVASVGSAVGFFAALRALPSDAQALDDAQSPPLDAAVQLQIARLLRGEALGLAMAAVAVLISAGGKVDGGGALVVIYLLVLELGLTEAIALSSITICGGALVELLVDIKRSKRFVSAPLINWQVMLVMQPMLLMGSSFGASIGSILPTWLLLAGFTGYLGYTGTKAAKKAVKTGRQEKWRCCGGHETITLLGAPGSAFESDDAYISYSASIPWRKVGLNAGVFVGTMLLTSLQGGALYPSPLGIPPTSFLFVFVSFLPFVFLSVSSHYIMRDVVGMYQLQQNPRYILSQSEIQWSPQSIRSFPLMSLAAGAVSGMFGVSGGVISGPLLRNVGVGPGSATAMTSVAAFFSTSQASFNYLLWGKLGLRLVLFALPVGALSTLVARFLLARVVRKYRARTLLFVVMGVVMLSSLVPFVARRLH